MGSGPIASARIWTQRCQRTCVGDIPSSSVCDEKSTNDLINSRPHMLAKSEGALGPDLSEGDVSEIVCFEPCLHMVCSCSLPTRSLHSLWPCCRPISTNIPKQVARPRLLPDHKGNGQGGRRERRVLVGLGGRVGREDERGKVGLGRWCGEVVWEGGVWEGEGGRWFCEGSWVGGEPTDA